jgi:NAD(P)H-quinone oxidoreductase subunit 5
MTLQPDPGSTLPIWHAALVIGPALAAAAAALFAGSATGARSAWAAARAAASTALGLAGLSLLAVLLGSHGTGHGLRADAVGAVTMALVAFVGWVIVRYSTTLLEGERDARRYVRWLMATLSTVTLVVATNHVLVLALAWTATSLALHRLLTFFGDRPAAVVAAHKKFIVGRAADLCMLAASGLLFHAFGTLHIDALAARAASAPQLPWAAQAAVLLICCAAVLKCAQLPFHGWLIQVMEAPTPVSALLHAGVVNLGGFVLIRFAPLVADVPAAQALLVAAGTATAVLASLVTTTRISIKVSLAWSTCAQMGFMLMQCGLGAWQMALLHLVAHSLYKAHAFLGAGGVVRRTTLAQLAPRAPAPGALALAAGALAGAGMTVAAGAAIGALAPGHAASPVAWVLSGVLALALVPLVHAQSPRLGGLWLPALGLGAFGVALAYFGLHAALAPWVPQSTTAPSAALWIGVAAAFGALFVLQSIVAVAPHGTLSRRLYPWFYGGLFLDEHFTRIAFALWRPPVPAAAVAALPAADATLAIDPLPAIAGART